MNYPKISIITPSYNQGQYLEETILSIINQNYPNLEYIIIDGGSNDNSIEIIKKYEKYLAYWVSEKDEGQSDAINKGLEKVTGDVFNWINSDDYLEKDALNKIASAYLQNKDAKAFCFGLSHLYGEKKIPFLKINNPEDKTQCFCDPVINQPATFYHRDAIQQFGKLNPHLHYCMDYEWWLKFMFIYGTSAIYVNEEKIAVFRMHAASKTSSSHIKFIDDIANILYAIALQVDLKEYTSLLAKGFLINEKYSFNINLKKIDQELIKKMVIYFSLKWGHLIYNKQHFNFAKEIIKTISAFNSNLSDKESVWLKQIERQVKYKSWSLLLFERKLTTLINSRTKILVHKSSLYS